MNMLFEISSMEEDDSDISSTTYSGESISFRGADTTELPHPATSFDSERSAAVVNEAEGFLEYMASLKTKNSPSVVDEAEDFLCHLTDMQTQINTLENAQSPAASRNTRRAPQRSQSFPKVMHEQNHATNRDDSFEKNVIEASKKLRSMSLPRQTTRHTRDSNTKITIPIAAAVDESNCGDEMEVLAHTAKPAMIQNETRCCSRRSCYIAIGVVLVMVLAVVLVVIATDFLNTEATSVSPPAFSPTDASAAPSVSPMNPSMPFQDDNTTTAPTGVVPPPSSPPAKYCFQNKSELQQAVDSYTQGDRESILNSLGKIGDWCVSKVTDFSGLFQDKTSFNESLELWDMSNAVSVQSMFENAIIFNQDLSRWNTSSVVTMDRMFRGSTSFNGDIAFWDTSKVVSMSYVFGDVAAFNRDVSLWDTSRVTSMNGMWSKTQSFNRYISGWNVSAVTDMGRMFNGARRFNQPIGAWDVSSVTTMRWMFQGASSFNQSLANWNVSSLVDMAYMFWLATSFTGSGMSSWNVSKVVDMTMAFQSSRAFSSNLCPWKSLISQETKIEGIFLESGCPETLDPDMTRLSREPFCFRCS